MGLRFTGDGAHGAIIVTRGDETMTDPTIALTRQMLEWISRSPRTYSEVLEVWRTSCPRLSIWEDACIAGLIEYDPVGRIVAVSPKGMAWLGETSEALR